MEQYINLLKQILTEGERTNIDRTGAGTKGIFAPNPNPEFDLAKGFPVVTTKSLYWEGVIGEALWFLRGETNIQPLLKLKKPVKIWSSDTLRYNLPEVMKYGLFTNEEIKDAQEKAKKARSILARSDEFQNTEMSLDERINASKEYMKPAKNILKIYETKIKEDDDFARNCGNLGPLYGYQWRRKNEKGEDQITSLEKDLKNGGRSRRNVVNAFFYPDLNSMALPPCHMLWQVYVSPETQKLSIRWDQRSCDTILGIPFNIACYAFIGNLLAHTHGYEPGKLTGHLGDTHIYLPHIEAAKEQLERQPKELPKLLIKTKRDSITEYKPEDFELIGYNPHPALKNPTEMYGGFF